MNQVRKVEELKNGPSVLMEIRPFPHQTGSSDLAVQEPKRDDEEAVLVRVHLDLKEDQKPAIFKYTVTVFKQPNRIMRLGLINTNRTMWTHRYCCMYKSQIRTFGLPDKERTYREVVEYELGPAEQVGEAIKGGQLAAMLLLALVVGNGVGATQIVHWSHHPQT